MLRIELDHASVAFTTREGGVSCGSFASLNLGMASGDDPAKVAENREIVRGRLELDGIAFVKQVHGSSIFRLEDLTASETAEADGITNTRSQWGLAALGADCPALALASPERVAIVHCGWRPLAAGIVEQAIELFQNDGQVQAAIGPGIGFADYEVGPEVVAQLGRDAENGAYVDRHLDLHAVIINKLTEAGVDRVERVSASTFAEPEVYFSYRRDGAATGRQAGIVWRSN